MWHGVWKFLWFKSQNTHFAARYIMIHAQIGHWRVSCVLNLISRLFQMKMVDFEIQTSNTSLFFITILILNKNITRLDTKAAYSYR